MAATARASAPRVGCRGRSPHRAPADAGVGRLRPAPLGRRPDHDLAGGVAQHVVDDVAEQPRRARRAARRAEHDHLAAADRGLDDDRAARRCACARGGRSPARRTAARAPRPRRAGVSAALLELRRHVVERHRDAAPRACTSRRRARRARRRGAAPSRSSRRRPAASVTCRTIVWYSISIAGPADLRRRDHGRRQRQLLDAAVDDVRDHAGGHPEHADVSRRRRTGPPSRRTPSACRARRGSRTAARPCRARSG